MLVSLTSRYVAGNKKDVEVLQRIFAALGLEGGPSPLESGQSSSRISAAFAATLHSFEIVSGSGGPAEADLFFRVSDPHLASQIVKQNGGEIIAGLSDKEVADVGFRIKLPSGARVQFGAFHGAPDSVPLQGLAGSLGARGKRFGVVVSRFNAFITERLLQGAYDGLVRAGALRKDITIVRAPGAFEIPSASRMLAETRKYDAILCIGCLLRGDTAHYDVIVNEVTRGIGQSAQETGVPHAFGVLTCDTLEQAIDRAGLKMGNKGLEAAMAAVEMANLGQSLRGSVRNASGNKPAKKKSSSRTAKPISRRKKN
jgi:6,7-dimethyl-8-ribityllumazine synthase